MNPYLLFIFRVVKTIRRQWNPTWKLNNSFKGRIEKHWLFLQHKQWYSRINTSSCQAEWRILLPIKMEQKLETPVVWGLPHQATTFCFTYTENNPYTSWQSQLILFRSLNPFYHVHLRFGFFLLLLFAFFLELQLATPLLTGTLQIRNVNQTKPGMLNKSQSRPVSYVFGA